MKKSILNLGKALNSLEQKAISGGGPFDIHCMNVSDCPPLESVVACINGQCIYPWNQ